MIGNQDLARLQGATAYDSTGEKVGKVGQVYTDADGIPVWVAVSTGFFGLSESLAPLAGANLVGNQLELAQTKDTIKDAPRVEKDQNLDTEEEQALYAHYGLDTGGTGSLGRRYEGDPTTDVR